MVNLRLSATAIVALAGAAYGDDIEIHGSGTTNPSKCFWHIMNTLEEQIKSPVRLTYRAVGSSTGIAEFIGVNHTGPFEYKPYNDFGAGDIPINEEKRIAMITNDKNPNDFVHLPFVLSAVGFFHNIPGVPQGNTGLNMTACLLSRVFSGDIDTWDHPDILKENQGLNVRPGLSIFVARRGLGSSSTYSITNFLYGKCPQTADNPKGWPLDKVGAKIAWDTSTNKCDGSGPMTDCIVNNEGAIGYIDSAHGHEENLLEIEIQNANGKFLSSKEAGPEGIRAAATDLSSVPDKADDDFSKVEFYNKPGPNTWPITLVSYIYIRKELPEFIVDPKRRTLLKAFAKALYDPKYIEQCQRYGHIGVPEKLRNIALNGIEMLDVSDDGNSNEWIFEDKTTGTLVGEGQGDRVISTKRRSFTLYEVDRVADDVAVLQDALVALRIQVATSDAQLLEAGAKSEGDVFTEDDQRKLDIAMGLAVFSTVMWGITVVFFVWLKMCIHKDIQA